MSVKKISEAILGVGVDDTTIDLPHGAGPRCQHCKAGGTLP